ncbi:transmembrane 9 superfamily member 2-like [Ruditapes philippinarum]|uniref:transmembrane 9 superfamily member 2-like n=1 Tax=Ruditapes philippinarum TaxID=129788 RepID=UPI00295A5728|nr:transmembrane 9 superfamily member 2-like [Ruditapes philippinarum]
MAVFLYLALLTISTVILQIEGFYLPGLAPVLFCSSNGNDDDDCQIEVPVFVNRLNSLRTLIPYEYDMFDFCGYDESQADPQMNLGQVVFGERIKPSLYKFYFKEDRVCEKVCEKNYYPGNKTSLVKLNMMRKMIDQNYNLHWIVDNMPVTYCYEVESGGQYCTSSFPVGCYVAKDFVQKDFCVTSDTLFTEPDTHYFFNHIDFTIKYHPSADDSGRILSVWATPKSIAYNQDIDICQDNNLKAMGIRNGHLMKETTITYTYSVRWVAEENIKWASRWDYILEDFPANEHLLWLNCLNSLIVAMFLASILAVVLRKILLKKTVQTSKQNGWRCWKRKNDESQFKWKLIYAYIFRPPGSGMALAVLNGSGVQLIVTAVIILVLATIGVLSPANRGALETCILVFYVCLGSPAGYVSARLYKAFGGERKLLNAILTATVCPGIVFVLILISNFLYMIEESSAAIPFTTILALLGLWLGISLPLTLLGSFFGFRKKGYQYPVKTSEVARQVPPLRLHLKPVSGMIIGGFLPFGTIFLHLFFILNSIFAHQLYYKFGFLALGFIMLVVTCFLVTILLSYFHLCAEDYRWWWRSFLNSSFCAVYMFIYCIYYYAAKTDFDDGVSAFIYGIYVFILSFLLFLVTGSVGFFSSFWFVRKIYSNVKECDLWSTKDLQDEPLG